KALQQDGHDVSIYTFSLQYPAFLFPGKTQYSDAAPPKGVTIYRKINTIHPLNWLKVGEELRKEATDLVIVKYWLPLMASALGPILRRVKKNKHTKVIGLLHNIIPHKKRMGDQGLTRYFLRPVDAFLSLSRSVIAESKKFDTQKPRAYNPHPVFDHFGEKVPRKEAAQYLNLDVESKYILFFGIIRDYKGLDWLLEAFSKTRAKAHVKHIIAGEYYADKDQYDQQIADLKLQNKVIVHDHFIKEEEVKYYFSIANLVAQPYKNATQSGVTQIAYHFNCPMLVTKVGGLPEMIPDHKIGLVVNPDISAITQGIEDYFTNNLEDEFKQNFEEEKKKYSWGKLNQTIYSLYERIK